MSTTDTRSGFRLPWSSDRPRDDATPAESADAAAEAVATEAAAAPDFSDGSETDRDGSWPDIDVSARLHDTTSGTPRLASGPQEAAMAEPLATRTPGVAAPRKPSKLMAELVAAMRSTAEVAREQARSQLEADARQVTEEIRKGSTEGTAALRQQSDEDITRIREWSKAEIARIREETDQRVATRKAALEAEIAAHSADIDRRIGEIDAAVAAYEAEMAAFFERLLGEDDPARLATMAESMPEPPSLAAVADDASTSALAEAAGWDDPAVERDGAGLATGNEISETDAAFAAAEAASVEAEAEAMAGETWDVGESGWDTPQDGPAGNQGPWGTEDASGTDFAADGWTDGAETADPAADAPEAAGSSSDADVARWTADSDAGAPAEAGSPVDRGSIMAALEAAAEAVVAAEAAAESADQAEAAADVAETAAELIVGRVDSDEEAEHEAEAAFAARMEAGGIDREPSLADRLASLLPGAGSAEADAAPTTTQVVVTGLVSVASIASFKRHLGRAHGVQSVTVASGPDGEFVFNVTHRTDSGLRDAIPALPGFGARVTGTGDGVLNVAARDPEAEG
jgi:hypothetical protein